MKDLKLFRIELPTGSRIAQGPVSAALYYYRASARAAPI
jgi:hypothetical protein